MDDPANSNAWPFKDNVADGLNFLINDCKHASCTEP